MNALGERIAATIAAQGPMSIAEFMTLCLHDPTDGAYAAHNPIGAGGDYVTSPEISQTFGEMCGLWLVQTWHNNDRPKRPLLVELGPGRGTMIRDILRTIHSAARKFLADAEIVLVEASPVLEAQQREVLRPLGLDIRWVKSFADVTIDRPLYLVANEFFDCLPIHQYLKTEQGWCEKMIGVKDGALLLGLKRIPVPAAVLPPAFENAPLGGVCETSPAMEATVGDIAKGIAAFGGGALLIDYGYAAPTFKETLQAIQRHKYADVLAAPGSCDLSAHVDFAALKRAGEAGGAKVCGPMDQGDFLAALGIEVRAQRLIMSNAKEARTIVLGVQRLLDPKLMGSLFKVVALTRKDDTDPPGFEAEV